jgi:pterin-4a-carbinolamine dehydratase
MSSLSDKQINLQLEDLAGWQRDGNSIVKTYHFADFIEAMSKVVGLDDAITITLPTSKVF